jgi:hypothetical protein
MFKMQMQKRVDRGIEKMLTGIWNCADKAFNWIFPAVMLLQVL